MIDKVKRNIENFRRFQQEVIVEGNFAHIDELMAPELLVHRAANVSLLRLNGQEVPDQPVLRRPADFEKTWRAAMAGRVDHSRVIDEIYGVDDVVFARWRIQWSHVAPFRGIPPSGRRVSVDEAAIIHFDEEGRMTQGWYITDQLDMFQQLGAQIVVTGGSEG